MKKLFTFKYFAITGKTLIPVLFSFLLLIPGVLSAQEAECTPPSFTATPGNIEVNNDAGVCEAEVTYTVTATGDPVPALYYEFRTAPGEVPFETGTGTGSGSTFPVGVTYVTVIAENGCVPPITTDFTVTVVDAEAPVVSVVLYEPFENDGGACGATISFDRPEVTENCDYTLTARVREDFGDGTFGPFLSGFQDPDGYYPVGDYQIRWRATDPSGNFGMRNSSFSVVDTEAPVIECPTAWDGGNSFSRDTDPGLCTFTPSGFFDPVISDNCGVDYLAYRINGGDWVEATTVAGVPFENGTNTIEWLVRDEAGNEASCSYDVTVNDKEDPVFTGDCGGGTVVEPLALKSGALFEGSSQETNSIDPDAEDYYSSYKTVSALGLKSGGTGGNALVYIDFAHSNDGVVDGLTNLGYTVTFASGWSDFDTELASGTFDLAVAMKQSISAPSFNTAIAQNHISSGGKMIFATWQPDLTEAALFEAAFTGSSNCGSVTITDTDLANGITNPVALTNPGWRVYSLGLTATGSGEVLATFDCSGDAAIVRGNGGRTIMLGYLSDTPPMGERQSLFENVIESLDDGMIVTNEGIIVGNDPGECGAVVEYPPCLLEVSDNCGVESVVPDIPSGFLFPVGVTTVTVTATDVSGNTAERIFTVTVEDTEDPTIECPADITRDTDPGVCYAVIEDIGNPVTDDNCGVESVDNDAPADNIYPKGETIVTWTVTDAAGNTATCEQLITVEDNEAPVINACGETFIVEMQPIRYWFWTYWQGYLNTEEILATISDNCDDVDNGLTVEFSQTLFVPNDWGENTETVTVTDEAGNSTTCEITVIVRYPLKSGMNNMFAETEIEEELQPLDVNVYPNPTSGKLSLDIINLNNPKVSAAVYNLNGQLVFQNEFHTDGRISIDLTGNTSGMYLLRVVADEKIFNHKIILE
jgi:large repetitive protein